MLNSNTKTFSMVFVKTQLNTDTLEKLLVFFFYKKGFFQKNIFSKAIYQSIVFINGVTQVSPYSHTRHIISNMQTDEHNACSKGDKPIDLNNLVTALLAPITNLIILA